MRSVQRVNADGSLTFYCAIDEGVVLRAARGVGLVEDLERTLEVLRRAVGPPQLVIGCDCILRAAEATQSGLTDRVAELLGQNNTVGFATYGEQFGGFHVNQTLTGIAIGHRRPYLDTA